MHFLTRGLLAAGALALAIAAPASAQTLPNPKFGGLAISGCYGHLVGSPTGSGVCGKPIYATAYDLTGSPGNGVVDDGPMLRAAYAACVAGNFGRVFVPSPPVAYMVLSLDPTGTAGLPIGDGRKAAATLTIASGSATLTASSAVFLAADAGASIDVPGAGASGGLLLSTVQAYLSPTQVTLANNAGATLSASAQTLQIGHSNTCDFDFEAFNSGWNFNIGNTGVGYGGVVRLGPGLNRPLVYVRTKAASPTFRNVILDGNGANQTGWSGGPNGKLYTVQVEDGSFYPEGSIKLFNSAMVSGYNGNLYIGSGRGTTLLRDTVSLYGGQSSADTCVLLNGYDGVFEGLQGFGGCAGVGLYVGEGSQYQITDAAFWQNYIGLVLNGGAVNYFTAENLNFQNNQLHGLVETATAPFSNNTAAGHLIANATFDGNNTANAGGNDIQLNGNTLLSIANVAFLGNSTSVSGGPRAVYNVGVSGTNEIKLANASFGASSAATAPFQAPNQVLCANCNLDFTWTPVLGASGGNGSVTYSTQEGHYRRVNNQEEVTFKVGTNAWTGASGNVTITGLPLFANSGVNSGSCTFGIWNGLTLQAGYTQESGVVAAGSATINLFENGSAKTDAATQFSEISSPSSFIIQGSCFYTVAN